jgi:hypothetical protein
MSTYYLKSISSNIILTDDIFNTLDEAIIKARQLTKETPLDKISILKSIAVIQFSGIGTGEHEEVFFN